MIAIRGESHDAVVNWRRRSGVVEVDIAVLCEVGIKGQTHQTPLTDVKHIDVNEGIGKQLPIFDYLDIAILLGNEDPAIGCKLHCSRSEEASGHDGFRESSGQRNRENPSIFEAILGVK